MERAAGRQDGNSVNNSNPLNQKPIAENQVFPTVPDFRFNYCNLELFSHYNTASIHIINQQVKLEFFFMIKPWLACNVGTYISFSTDRAGGFSQGMSSSDRRQHFGKYPLFLALGNVFMHR